MLETTQPRIVIVGGGFGGLAAAIELQQHGFTDLTILERGPDIGGTWFYNSYPGAACDVPSHLYSFSYAQRRDWSRLCSPQAEILAYLHAVAHDYGVDRLVVPGTEVGSCAWDDAARRWTVTSTDGRAWDADAVVLATGQLHQPSYPRPVKAAIQRLPGLQAHRRAYIFEYTESLTLAIRHPNSFGRVVRAMSTAFMRRQLTDPVIRRKAWPDYTFGCKRILFSSSFLPALQRPNVELVTEPLERMTPTGLVTVDGTAHEVDCIIYGTGFRTTEFMFPMEITGGGGMSLREAWAAGPHAHFGMVVPGFPSLFMMYGPNTNTSGGSIIVYLEAQASYLRQALQQVRDRGAAAIDIRPEVEAESDRLVQARFAGTAWTRCDSWYRDEHGRIVTNWPGSFFATSPKPARSV